MSRHTPDAALLFSTGALCCLAMLAGGCANSNNAHQANAPQLQRAPGHNGSLDPFSTPSGQTRSTPSMILAGIDAGTIEAETPAQQVFGDRPNNVAKRLPSADLFDPTVNIRQVTLATEGADFDPTLDRDGKRLFFASTRHSSTANIYVQSVDGTAVTQLTNDPAHDVMPSLSPDASRLAFASNRNGTWDIYLMNSDGGQAVQVTSDPTHELHPSWSSDGQYIAYCKLGEVSNRWEIWVTDLTRPNSHTFITHGLFPQWHPTESRLLFQRSRDRGDKYFSVWTIDFVDGEGVSPTEIISSSVAAVINPAWSPDGRFIACSTIFLRDAVNTQIPGTTDDSGEAPTFADIWIIRADGSARTNLTGGFFVNTMPTWGSDGTLYFVSNRSGVETVWSVNPRRAVVAADTHTQGTTGIATGPVDDN